MAHKKYVSIGWFQDLRKGTQGVYSLQLYMAHMWMCRWTGYGFSPFCPKQRIYFVWVCHNFRQGIAYMIYLIL